MLRSAVGPLGTSQVREAVQVRKSGEYFNYDLGHFHLVHFVCNFSPPKNGSAKQLQTKFQCLSPNTGFIHQLLWTSAGFEGYRSASGATDNR